VGGFEEEDYRGERLPLFLSQILIPSHLHPQRPCTSFVIADEPQRGPALTTTGWEWRASRGEEHEASVVRKIEVAPAKNKG
jgi:hypothetical protein